MTVLAGGGVAGGVRSDGRGPGADLPAAVVRGPGYGAAEPERGSFTNMADSIFPAGSEL